MWGSSGHTQSFPEAATSQSAVCVCVWGGQRCATRLCDTRYVHALSEVCSGARVRRARGAPAPARPGGGAPGAPARPARPRARPRRRRPPRAPAARPRTPAPQSGPPMQGPARRCCRPRGRRTAARARAPLRRTQPWATPRRVCIVRSRAKRLPCGEAEPCARARTPRLAAPSA